MTFNEIAKNRLSRSPKLPRSQSFSTPTEVSLFVSTTKSDNQDSRTRSQSFSFSSLYQDESEGSSPTPSTRQSFSSSTREALYSSLSQKSDAKQPPITLTPQEATYTLKNTSKDKPNRQERVCFTGSLKFSSALGVICMVGGAIAVYQIPFIGWAAFLATLGFGVGLCAFSFYKWIDNLLKPRFLTGSEMLSLNFKLTSTSNKIQKELTQNYLLLIKENQGNIKKIQTELLSNGKKIISENSNLTSPEKFLVLFHVFNLYTLNFYARCDFNDFKNWIKENSIAFEKEWIEYHRYFKVGDYFNSTFVTEVESLFIKYINKNREINFNLKKEIYAFLNEYMPKSFTLNAPFFMQDEGIIPESIRKLGHNKLIQLLDPVECIYKKEQIQELSAEDQGFLIKYSENKEELFRILYNILQNEMINQINALSSTYGKSKLYNNIRDFDYYLIQLKTHPEDENKLKQSYEKALMVLNHNTAQKIDGASSKEKLKDFIIPAWQFFLKGYKPELDEYEKTVLNAYNEKRLKLITYFLNDVKRIVKQSYQANKDLHINIEDLSADDVNNRVLGSPRTTTNIFLKQILKLAFPELTAIEPELLNEHTKVYEIIKDEHQKLYGNGNLELDKPKPLPWSIEQNEALTLVEQKLFAGQPISPEALDNLAERLMDPVTGKSLYGKEGKFFLQKINNSTNRVKATDDPWVGNYCTQSLFVSSEQGIDSKFDSREESGENEEAFIEKWNSLNDLEKIILYQLKGITSGAIFLVHLSLTSQSKNTEDFTKANLISSKPFKKRMKSLAIKYLMFHKELFQEYAKNQLQELDKEKYEQGNSSLNEQIKSITNTYTQLPDKVIDFFKKLEN